jgi:hypothetical protein
MCTKIRDGCSEIWAEAENHEIPSGESARAAAENTLNFLSALRALNSFTHVQCVGAGGWLYEVCMWSRRPRNQVVSPRRARVGGWDYAA